MRFAGVLVLPFTGTVLRLADRRDWLTAMNAALLISLPLTMYGFHFDQIVLLPAIVQIIDWLWRGELSPRWTWAVGGALVIVYLLLFAMLTLPFSYSHWFTWTPLVLAALYGLAWKQRGYAQ